VEFRLNKACTQVPIVVGVSRDAISVYISLAESLQHCSYSRLYIVYKLMRHHAVEMQSRVKTLLTFYSRSFQSRLVTVVARHGRKLLSLQGSCRSRRV